MNEETKTEFKTRREFTSEEVCKILTKELGIKDEPSVKIDVDWIINKEAKDNKIVIYY